MLKALIFDFDGLILDTETPDFDSWQEIYEAHGCALPLDMWSRCIGTGATTFDPLKHLEYLIGSELDRTEINSRRRLRYAELVALESPLPGVIETVDASKRLGLRIGLASSSTRDWVIGHLARLDIDRHFECIRCADDVAHTKPEPDLYCGVLTCLEVYANECVALEDSPNGIAAAKAAGIYCVAVPNALTRKLDLRQADMCVVSLAELSLDSLSLRFADRKSDRWHLV